MVATEQLSREECWTLLRDHTMGRVAFSENAMPTIAPIAYTVDDDHLLLHCRSERLAAQLDRQVVALEVDDTFARRAECTSVVATGTAERLAHSLDAPDRTTVLLRVGRLRGNRPSHAA